MIAILLGFAGVAFALNGLMMLPSVTTALQQQVVAIYLVGGVLVLGVAVIAARALSAVDHLGAIARAMVADRAAIPVKGLANEDGGSQGGESAKQ